MPNLKYKQEIEDIGCNLNGFCEQDRVAFRWTFDVISHPRNFLPRFLLDLSKERDNCKGWGLSFFDTQDSAKERLQELTTNRKYLYKKLGTHIAAGMLNKTDGISNDAGNDGHFTHFEYPNVDLSIKFNIVEQLY